MARSPPWGQAEEAWLERMSVGTRRRRFEVRLRGSSESA